MGEAAAKEPSMEEILSSIRKIITDDGGSDASKKAAATSEKKPDVQIATSKKADKSTAAPDAAMIKSALAAIKENVKEAAVETEEVKAVIKKKAPKIAEPVKAEEPEVDEEVISGLASEQADSISFVDTPSAEADVSDEATKVETIKKMVEAAPITVAAETVSEVPAQSSKNSTQDDEAMASSEAADFKGALMSSNTDQIVNEAFEELRRVTMDNIEDKTEAMLRPMLSEWLDNNLPTLVERLVREEIERVSGSR